MNQFFSNLKIGGATILALASIAIASSCSSDPILRENVNDIKSVHIVSSVIALPDSYTQKPGNQQEVTGKVELQCNENYKMDVEPKRWNWEVKGTCEDCAIEFEMNPAVLGPTLSGAFDQGLRSGKMQFASSGATAALSGVKEIREKIAATYKNGINDWDDGSSWDSIAGSSEMKSLLSSNPDQAFLFVIVYANPVKGGTVFQKAKEDRFEACQRVLTVTPAADGVDFELSARMDLRYNGRPDTNLVQEDLNTSVNDSSPLRFSLPQSKPTVLNINWDQIEISQESTKKSDFENTFTALAPQVKTGGLEAAALKSLNGPARELGVSVSGKIKDFFESEKKASGK